MLQARDTHEIAFDANQQPSVLVVDDERGPRESLRVILSPRYEVLTASGATAALEILGTQNVDLVTVDLNMPGMKGDELLRIIRDEYPRLQVIIITGFGTLETAVDAVRNGVSDYLTKPFDVVQVNAAVSRALDDQASRRRLVRFLEKVSSVVGKHRSANDILEELDGDETLRERMAAILGEPALKRTPREDPMSQPQTMEFLEVLADTIESRDPGLRGHARRVAFYAGLIAERLCLGAKERDVVRVAAFLHDLGKLGLPPGALPRDQLLNADQRRSVEEHPAISERLVRPLGFSAAIPSAMRHHHERWDGTGYPDALGGDDIPLAARIIAVADAYDVMISERPYQQALEPGVAIEALNKLAGSQFDPSIVTAFIAIAETGVCPIEGHAVREALERVGQASDLAAGSAFKGEH
jgi:putative two-component system response regulator